MKRLVDFTVATYGGIDIVVCHAGINSHTGLLMETEAKTGREILEVNVMAGFLLVKEALPYLERSKAAAVLFMGSYLAYVPNNFVGFYSLSKAALLSLVKSMAMELAPKGIRVNGLSPYVIKTEFSRILWVWDAEFSKNTPIGRMGTPEDVSGPASFLLSREASYIAGEVMVVSGGFHTRL